MGNRFKFRLWDKTTKTMDYNPILTIRELQNGVYATEIMQCTGLPDKNGKDIYDSDIVKFRGHDYSIGDIGCIIHDDKKACFSIKWKDGLVHECPTYYNQINKTFEIIGNIYENPKLFEVTAND